MFKPKLCIDCIHHKELYCDVPRISLETGREYPHTKSPPSNRCWTMRETGICGPTGQFWEPREEAKPLEEFPTENRTIIGWVMEDNGIIGPGYQEWKKPVFGPAK